MKDFLLMLLFAVIAQFVVFIPFFIIWIQDCKELGKENLAVSLKERFLTWCIYCPIWIMPFIVLGEE